MHAIVEKPENKANELAAKLNSYNNLFCCLRAVSCGLSKNNIIKKLIFITLFKGG